MWLGTSEVSADRAAENSSRRSPSPARSTPRWRAITSYVIRPRFRWSGALTRAGPERLIHPYSMGTYRSVRNASGGVSIGVFL
jgi:hypothetical protein